MSGNVHSNPGLIFLRTVCAGNVTWRRRSVQCCNCSRWVNLRCSQIFFSKFRTLGSSYSYSCPLLRPASSGENTVASSSDFSSLHTSTVRSGLPSANAALSPHPRLQTFYPLPPILALLPHHFLFVAVSLYLLLSLPP